MQDRSTVAAPRWLKACLLVIILAGLALRLVAPGATVFCRDQARACALAEDIAAGRWETGGMPNSGGFRNLPGFAWLLAAVWKAAPHPLALLWFIQAVNLLAFGAAALLIRRWLGVAACWWACAFFAAAPWAIHYCRWIWAQHLLFPSAMLVYMSLWAWLGKGNKWGALGVVLGLTLMVQIHLAGVVLAVAVVLLLLWRRTRLPWLIIFVGLCLAAISIAPYLLGGHFGAPRAERFGYQHFWRIIPSAAMSVSGLWWSLEYRSGFPQFMQAMGLRLWFYYAVMLAPPALLAYGVFSGLSLVRRRQKCAALEPSDARGWLRDIVMLVVFIPVAFILLGLRTSPTYVPLWYPLPFALMGWAMVRLAGRLRPRVRLLAQCGIVAVLLVQLAFFAEHIRYIDRRGGVPGSNLNRSYAGLRQDLDELVANVEAEEIVLSCPHSNMGESVAYLLRHAEWRRCDGCRVLIRYNPPWIGPTTVEPLDEATLPEKVYAIHPWNGPQQQGGRIRLAALTSVAD